MRKKKRKRGLNPIFHRREINGKLFWKKGQNHGTGPLAFKKETQLLHFDRAKVTAGSNTKSQTQGWKKFEEERGGERMQGRIWRGNPKHQSVFVGRARGRNVGGWKGLLLWGGVNENPNKRGKGLKLVFQWTSKKKDCLKLCVIRGKRAQETSLCFGGQQHGGGKGNRRRT